MSLDVPVDFEKNFVFVHIPKTGGTSIEKMFGLMCPDKFFSRKPVMGLRPSEKTPQHFTYLELASNLPSAFLNTAYKFAFVRNPWDRFVSEYLWRRKLYSNNAGVRRHALYNQTHLATLDAFVDVLHFPVETRIHAVRGFDGHLETQLSFLVDHAGTIAMDFLGRFENFCDDVSVAAARVGLQDAEIPHLMRGDRSANYRTYYNAYTRSAVEQFYQHDIAALGYTF